MKTYTFHHVDSFTDTLFWGNPAGVVFDAEWLSEETMQAFAREVNLSETVFITNQTPHSCTMRYFTPSEEVKFCGHATVAGLYMWAREGKRKMDTTRISHLTIKNWLGDLSMSVDTSWSDPVMSMTTPETTLIPSWYTGKNVAQWFWVHSEIFPDELSVLLDASQQYAYISVSSYEDLQSLNPMSPKLQQKLHKGSIYGLGVMCSETVDKNADLHCRWFFPTLWLPEDPVTWSMQWGIVTYARIHNHIDLQKKQLLIEQWHIMWRPGNLTVDILDEEKNIYTISGRAIHVYSAEISL